MIEMPWMDQVPGENLESCIALLNSLGWYLSITSTEKWILVNSGDQPMLRCNTREEAECFVYGLALGHAMLSKEHQDEIRRLMKSLE